MTHSPMSQNRVRDALELDTAKIREVIASKFRHARDYAEREGFMVSTVCLPSDQANIVIAALTAPPASDAAGAEGWPAGCIKPNACARHKSCMYAMGKSQCRHYGEDLTAAIAAAPTAPAQAPSRPVDAGRVEKSPWQKLMGAKIARINHATSIPGERVIGWRVPAEFAGLSDSLFLLEAIEKQVASALATQPTGTEASRPVSVDTMLRERLDLCRIMAEDADFAEAKEGFLHEIGRLEKALAAPRTPPQADSTGQGDVISEISAERRRQVEAEGWTPEHDDEHHNGEMCNAAAAYAMHAGKMLRPYTVPACWPWTSQWWKPSNARRDLVKAGALIVAEIERLDRLATPSQADAQTQEGGNV